MLSPSKKSTNLAISLNKYFWRFDSTWVSSTSEREYVEFQSKLYWTEDGAIAKVYDGTSIYQLGITKPSTSATAATASGSGSLTGTYTYCFTFYADSTGVESQPNTVTNSVTVTTKSIDLSGVPTSSDPQVDKVRVYRIGGSLTSYTLVTTLNEGTTTYNDNIADVDVEGTILASQNYHEAPTGLRYLVEHNSLLFGAVGSKLYFTPIAQPYAWGELDFLEYGADITGLGAAPTGLAVFTELTTYIVTGSDSSDFKSQLFSGSQGCISNSSIATLKGLLVWLSNDGLCFSKGGLVEVMSRPKLGRLEGTVLNAVVHDDVYYLLFDDKILALDLRFGSMYKEFDLVGERLGVFEDTLYAIISGGLHTLFTASSHEELTWKSPEFTEGDLTVLKGYKAIYVHSTGQLTFEVFIDGDSVLYTSLVKAGITEVKIPADKQRGSKIQFKATGAGTINEIEYKVVGRQNGR
jgi:hypothetical protein